MFSICAIDNKTVAICLNGKCIFLYGKWAVDPLSSATWHTKFMQFILHGCMWPASSAFSLARKCNWQAAIMAMRCVMQHAWKHKLQSFRLKWTYCSFPIPCLLSFWLGQFLRKYIVWSNSFWIFASVLSVLILKTTYIIFIWHMHD